MTCGFFLNTNDVDQYVSSYLNDGMKDKVNQFDIYLHLYFQPNLLDNACTAVYVVPTFSS